MNQNDKDNIRLSSYATYLSYLLRVPLGLIFSIVLIKCLSREEYGAYHIIISINTAVVYLSSFGLASVFVRYIPEFLEKKQADGIIKLTLWGIFIRLSSVVIILVAARLLSKQLFHFFSFTPFLREYFLAILIFVFLSKVEETLGPMLLGAYLEQIKLVICQVIHSTLRVAVVCYAFFIDSGLKSILIGLIFTELFTSIIFFAVSLKLTTQKVKSIRNKSPFIMPVRRMVRFGGYAYLLSSVGVFKDVMVDNFVISHYLGATEVAAYGFAYTILNIISNFNPTKLLKNLIEHVMIRKHIQHNDNYVFQISHRLTMIVSIFFLLPAISFLLMVLTDLIRLLNKAYLSSRSLIFILSLLILFNAMLYSYGYSLNVLEKMQYRFYANIFSIYNLIADIILIKIFGVKGIAIATSSAALFSLIYYHYVVTRKLKIQIHYYWPGIIKIILNTAISLIISWAWYSLIKHNIFTTAFIFGLAYLILSYVMNPFHSDDRVILKRLLIQRSRLNC